MQKSFSHWWYFQSSDSIFLHFTLCTLRISLLTQVHLDVISPFFSASLVSKWKIQLFTTREKAAAAANFLFLLLGRKKRKEKLNDTAGKPTKWYHVIAQKKCEGHGKVFSTQSWGHFPATLVPRAVRKRKTFPSGWKRFGYWILFRIDFLFCLLVCEAVTVECYSWTWNFKYSIHNHYSSLLKSNYEIVILT